MFSVIIITIWVFVNLQRKENKCTFCSEKKERNRCKPELKKTVFNSDKTKSTLDKRKGLFRIFVNIFIQ